MSSEGRCAACKYWSSEPDSNPRYEGSEHRHCSRMPSNEEIWRINADENHERAKALMAQWSGAPYCDDLSGEGSFMTPPTFGCVLFELGNAVRAVDGGT